MEVNRTFWYREKGSVKQAFSYAKDSQAENFAKKYGGVVVKGLELNDAELIDFVGSGQVYSVLKNSDPKEGLAEETNESLEYVVLVKAPDGDWRVWKEFATISDANTEAKNVIPFCESVIVVKQENQPAPTTKQKVVM